MPALLGLVVFLLYLAVFREAVINGGMWLVAPVLLAFLVIALAPGKRR